MASHREIFTSKGGDFLLRNAVGEDAPALFRFMAHVDRETTFLAREPGEFERTFTLERERELLDAWAAGDEKLFLVAVAGSGEVAATCGCSYSAARVRTRHLGEIAISVRKDFWRLGLGRRLMEIQENWCRENGVEKLCLEVDTRNTRALGLYLSQGFQVEGTLRRAAKMADGSYRDLYTMAKFLC